MDTRNARPSGSTGRGVDRSWTAPNGALTGKRVWLVDDSADIRALITLVLRGAGALVECEGDGLRAQVRIEADDPPDAMLLDRMLPGISGDRLLCGLRRREAWRDVPVIIVSARGAPLEIGDLMRAGATDYLCKPFAPSTLIVSLARALERRALA